LDLNIFLKDGTQFKMTILRLIECGINQKKFFIESAKEGRIEFPIENLSGFRIDRPKSHRTAYEDDSTVLYTAIGILSKHLI